MGRKVTKTKSRTTPKRSSKGKRGSKYLTSKNVKCTLAMPLQFRNDFLRGTDTTAARAFIYWQNTTATGGGIEDVMTLENSAEWGLYSSVYYSCTVNSMKIEYKPYKAVTNLASNSNDAVMEYRDLKSVSWINENEWPKAISGNGHTWTHKYQRQQPDFKSYGGTNRAFTKYVNVAKFNKRRALDPNQTILGEMPSIPRTHNTILELNATGFPAGHDMGMIYVTWYVTFKRPRLEAP